MKTLNIRSLVFTRPMKYFPASSSQTLEQMQRYKQSLTLEQSILTRK